MKRIISVLWAVFLAAVPAAGSVPRPVRPFPVAPLAADEKPVEVESYSVEARVNGAFASVRALIVLSNPNNRVLEKNFEFPLPDGATVCGYALDVNGTMTDGVVVKKEKARVAFEKEVKKGVDPGIAEHVKGNVWRTRVYPVPGKGTRRLRIDYVTPLAFSPEGDAALVLSMPRTKLKERSVSITVPIGGGMPKPVLGGLGDRRFAQAESVWRTAVCDKDVTPTEDVTVALPAMPDAISAVEKTGFEHWFAVSLKAPAWSYVSTSPPLTWRILWDASGSRSAADVAAALAVIEKLPENACYELVEFRNVPEKPFICATRAELLERIARVTYDGGTDFTALAAAHRRDRTENRTLLFTDGMDSLADDVPDFGTMKPIALVSGAARDLETLRRACGGCVVDLALRTPDEAYKFILTPPPGVEAVIAAGTANIQGVGQPAQGRVTVLGRLVADSTELSVDFGRGRRSAPVKLSVAGAKEGRLLATAWAAKRVNELSPRAHDNADELLAIGRRYGVVSPVTSMIVFETLSQWLEHGVEPPKTSKELHERWARLRPTEAQRIQNEERKREMYMTRLKSMWKSRIAWWENPIPSKPKTPKSGLFSGVATTWESGLSRARNSVMRLASRRSTPHQESASVMRSDSPSMDDNVGDMFEEAETAQDTPRVAAAKSRAPSPRSVRGAISVKEWDPETPYLTAIKDAKAALGPSGGTAYSEYMAQRAGYSASPAFYLDCGGWFFSQNERATAVRVLSNLMELKLDDPGMLRTCAWRLREAGEFEMALKILRKVAKLRPEDPHSFRDLAIVNEEIGRRDMSAAHIAEAFVNYHKAAFTAWEKDNGLWTAIVALEEFNALIAWNSRQKWPEGKAPVPPECGAEFRKHMDLDVRIALSWDVDNTDIDLHVLEPDGEEAYYRHKLTSTGGFLTHDVTTGFGPEEYLKKEAPKGVYKVLVNYFGSHQQTLLGPATVTATIFTDWGRPDEKRRTISLRLDKPKNKFTIGDVTLE